MNERMVSGLQYIGNRRVSRDAFHATNKDGAAMLLDGLISNGYAVQKDGRISLSETGKRALGANGSK